MNLSNDGDSLEEPTAVSITPSGSDSDVGRGACHHLHLLSKMICMCERSSETRSIQDEKNLQ
jgi:hypothetical protein